MLTEITDDLWAAKNATSKCVQKHFRALLKPWRSSGEGCRMRIGLHDSDDTGFPNLALMKISAWHKSRGDSVEWWSPLFEYDRVYSSKVFTFTPENPYLPPDKSKAELDTVSIQNCQKK